MRDLACDVCNKRGDGISRCSYGNEGVESIPSQRVWIDRHNRNQYAEPHSPQPGIAELTPSRLRPLVPDTNSSTIHRMSPHHHMSSTGTRGILGSLNMKNMSPRKERSRNTFWGSPGSHSLLRPEHQEVADSMTGVVGEPSESYKFFSS